MVRLVGGVEKWEDRKLWEDGKDFILSFLFGLEWKGGGMEKMSLNKFTHIPLLKNDAKLKKKNWQTNHTKKSNYPNFFIKIKKMFQKKSHPVKIKINYHAQALKNQKKKN